MKESKFFYLLLFLFLGIESVMSQDVSGDLSKAFSKGDVVTISGYMDEEIQYIAFSKSQRLSKHEAKQSLTLFFQQNKPAGFIIMHESMQKEQGFIVGKLSSQTKAFRIHCIFKSIDNRLSINQIRIDEFNE